MIQPDKHSVVWSPCKLTYLFMVWIYCKQEKLTSSLLTNPKTGFCERKNTYHSTTKLNCKVFLLSWLFEWNGRSLQFGLTLKFKVFILLQGDKTNHLMRSFVHYSFNCSRYKSTRLNKTLNKSYATLNQVKTLMIAKKPLSLLNGFVQTVWFFL